MLAGEKPYSEYKNFKQVFLQNMVKGADRKCKR